MNWLTGGAVFAAVVALWQHAKSLWVSVSCYAVVPLGTMDGERISIAFEQALKRVIQDCDDRPGEKKERTVTLTLAVKPRLDADGMCEDCDVQVAVTDSVPKRKSKVYNMALRKGGLLVYNDDSLDNVDQETMDFDD